MIVLALLMACNRDGRPLGTDTVDVTDDTTPDTPTNTDTSSPWVEPEERIPDVVVDCRGGGDFTTIRDAIGASRSGTKIGLVPCTYEEDIDYRGKTLDIFGIEGSAVTFVRGSGTGRVVKVRHGESYGTRLAGVTIAGGEAGEDDGAGVSIDLAMLELEDVVFTENVGHAIVYVNGAWIELYDVELTGNDIESNGGAFEITNGSALAQRLTIACDDADFGLFSHAATLVLDSDIRCGRSHGVMNKGNGIHLRRSRVESDGIGVWGLDRDDNRDERVFLYNNAIVGGDTAVYSEFMNTRVVNNVLLGGEVGLDLRSSSTDAFVQNNYASGSACGITTTADVDYELGWNAVTGGTGCAHGHDAVTGDPAFVDAPDDLRLLPDSPLVDAGDPDVARNDADGSRNDIGLHGGPEGDGPR